MPASKIGRERSDHQPQRRAAFVCSSVGFAWPDGQVVFDDLDLTFPDGLTGLIGRNGGGKSTLLRILTGELPPTSGSVLRPALVGYLPQQLTLEVDRPVAELLGVADRLAALDRTDAGQARPADLDLLDGHWDLPERITAALAELGLADLDLHARIGTLSGGQAVLSALAGLFLADRTRWSWTSRRTTPTGGPAGCWRRPYAVGLVPWSWSAMTASCWTGSTRSSRSGRGLRGSTAGT